MWTLNYYDLHRFNDLQQVKAIRFWFWRGKAEAEFNVWFQMRMWRAAPDTIGLQWGHSAKGKYWLWSTSSASKLHLCNFSADSLLHVCMCVCVRGTSLIPYAFTTFTLQNTLTLALPLLQVAQTWQEVSLVYEGLERQWSVCVCFVKRFRWAFILVQFYSLDSLLCLVLGCFSLWFVVFLTGVGVYSCLCVWKQLKMSGGIRSFVSAWELLTFRFQLNVKIASDLDFIDPNTKSGKILL